MQKKICPICERPLTGSGYCRLCRKLVFKPLIREVDYYLNETRPGQQTVLNERNGGRSQASLEIPEKDFREKTADFYRDMKQKSGGEAQRQKTSKTSKKASAKKETVWSGPLQKKSAGKTDGKGSKMKPGTVAAFLIILGVAVQFVSRSVDFMADRGARLVQEEPQNDVWDWEAEIQEEDAWGGGEIAIEEDEGSLEWVELDEEEIKAAGVRCNGSDHFAIRFIDVENLVKEEAYALGMETHMNLDSYNNRYEEGGEIREFYDTYRTYAMWNDDKRLEMSVTVSSDTATGEVHFISLSAHNTETNQVAVQMTEALADLAAGQEGTLAEGEIAAAVDSLEFLEKPEYNYYIYGYEDNGYAIELSPLHDWDEEEGNIV